MDELAALRKQVEQLSNDLGVLQDVHAIRRLQHAYGYYLDKCLYDEVVDLFSDSCEVYFMGGIYKGRVGARRLYCDRFRTQFTGGHNGPVYGFLLDHPQMQDVIDVAPDRGSAEGRFRCIMQAGSHESRQKEVRPDRRQWWEGGIYENKYVREGGIWKLKLLNYRVVFHGLYDKGWAYTPAAFTPFASKLFPEDPIGPDALMTSKPVLWPETEVLPFHYAHPVTGKKWTPA